MDLPRIISSLGFTTEEAGIYIVLLEMGHSKLSAISRKFRTDIKTTYKILESLLQKDIVVVENKKSELFFSAIKPERLLEFCEIRLEKAKLVLPELIALDNLNTVKPTIKYYEGKKGLISIMEDSLTAQGTILNWNDISIAQNSLKDYYPTYIHKKNVLNIFVQAILADSKQAQEFQKREKEEKREVMIFSNKTFPFKNEINIYNDKISIISHKEMMGVIIQSHDIAETQRSIFKLGWEYAKLLINNSKPKS